MAIGRHQCKNAWHLDYKGWISVCLDEALIALEESFFDLTDAQMRAFPIKGRNNISWIVMHTLQNLDEYTNLQGGPRPFPHEERWDLWQCRPEQRPKPGDVFPPAEQMLRWLYEIRARAEAILAGLDEPYLREKPGDHWPGDRADFYKRTILHAMAHVRQIWLLRGALGLTDGKSWPQQHYA
ncbi:MAG: DinB family protein [Phycisphaeraceae bacterium]|nr:DinB family protein [Phycisphaeraceae bacterium]